MLKNLVLGAVGLGALIAASQANAANVALTMWTDSSDAVTASGTGLTTIGVENLDGVTVSTSFAANTASPNRLTEGNIDIDNTTGTTQTLHITVGGNGYLGPDNKFALTGTILDSAGAASLGGAYFVDPTNSLNGLGMSIVGTQIGSFNSGALNGPDSFSFNGTGIFSVLGTYGMGETLTLTLAPGASIAVQGISMTATSGVPEPGTWAMGIAGFALLGALGLRKRKASRFAVA